LELCLSFLVIVDDFDFVRVTGPPFKAHPPLVVYSYAVLPFTITGKLLKPIAGRRPDILERFRCIQEQKFSVSRSL
jgi:hypothetical protein